MTLATIQIIEMNGVVPGAETIIYDSSQTDGWNNARNTNMGYSSDYSAEIPNMNPSTYPMTPGGCSYEKYQKFRVSANPSGNTIYSLKVWRSGSLGGSCIHKTNVGIGGTYVAVTSYTRPKNTTSSYTNDIQSSQPNENLGIGGVLGSSITTTGDSDYVVHQLQSNGSDTQGSTSNLNFQHNEIA